MLFQSTNAISGSPWRGSHVLITAGPTQEAIDPVRYISNHSTGKMGYALAEELAGRGARVTLVSGSTQLTPVHPGIQRVNVRSAAEMYDACCRYFPQSDVAILSAAVADYTPKVVAMTKIKKKDAEFSLELVKTVDIAAELGRQKRANQVMVGFALETDHEIENALKKLHSKNLDLIVLNSLQHDGAGFGHDTNQITLIDRQGRIDPFSLKTKRAVATDIIDRLAALLTGRQPAAVFA
ncbi:MAG: bifunctional phosphopantothenoylcysteine decarboxylase/phosphopantothenate--cysteine ligase CoaBC [Bacteroidetes bacterium]|nr:bifunctional phosphopantothenoylcysteine decarboxylase/phosphopantothenate--cysteine ligase CoaBC [Fibrella sp.]